mmetsp:Transcript_371/g.917  ORF Transcript_371/g.917 Transcript_371/m.917 type:complete len:489 (+) Transcript_371:65-1531(+)
MQLPRPLLSRLDPLCAAYLPLHVSLNPNIAARIRLAEEMKGFHCAEAELLCREEHLPRLLLACPLPHSWPWSIAGLAAKEDFWAHHAEVEYSFAGLLAPDLAEAPILPLIWVPGLDNHCLADPEGQETLHVAPSGVYTEVIHDLPDRDHVDRQPTFASQRDRSKGATNPTNRFRGSTVRAMERQKPHLVGDLDRQLALTISLPLNRDDDRDNSLRPQVGTSLLPRHPPEYCWRLRLTCGDPHLRGRRCDTSGAGWALRLLLPPHLVPRRRGQGLMPRHACTTTGSRGGTFGASGGHACCGCANIACGAVSVAPGQLLANSFQPIPSLAADHLAQDLEFQRPVRNTTQRRPTPSYGPAAPPPRLRRCRHRRLGMGVVGGASPIAPITAAAASALTPTFAAIAAVVARRPHRWRALGCLSLLVVNDTQDLLPLQGNFHLVHASSVALEFHIIPEEECGALAENLQCPRQIPELHHRANQRPALGLWWAGP